jgi:hypothetical protein
MNRLRLACAVFVGWLFVLFNVERIHEPLNLASFVYVIAAVIGVVTVGIKPLGSVSLLWLLSLPLGAFFVMKFVDGQAVLGPALPMTFLELCAIGLTVAIAHQIAFRLWRREKASAGMITDDPHRQTVSLWAAQSDLYREVRRARKHERPLSVLAVASSGQSVSPDEEQVLRELERELLDKYTSARIAGLLAKEAQDHGIITHCNRHFVILLPETDRDAADELAQRLNAAVKKSLGLTLQVGVATFPEEEVTLVGLLQRAEASMNAGEVKQTPPADANATQPVATQNQTSDEVKLADFSTSQTAVAFEAVHETSTNPMQRFPK